MKLLIMQRESAQIVLAQDRPARAWPGPTRHVRMQSATAARRWRCRADAVQASHRCGRGRAGRRKCRKLLRRSGIAARRRPRRRLLQGRAPAIVRARQADRSRNPVLQLFEMRQSRLRVFQIAQSDPSAMNSASATHCWRQGRYRRPRRSRFGVAVLQPGGLDVEFAPKRARITLRQLLSGTRDKSASAPLLSPPRRVARARSNSRSGSEPRSRKARRWFSERRPGWCEARCARRPAVRRYRRRAPVRAAPRRYCRAQ